MIHNIKYKSNNYFTLIIFTLKLVEYNTLNIIHSCPFVLIKRWYSFLCWLGFTHGLVTILVNTVPVKLRIV